MKDDFYVYAHLDNRGEIRYIGKGRMNRATTFCQRSKRWLEVFPHRNPRVKFLEKNLTELEAYNREQVWISKAIEDGCALANVARGGIEGAWDQRSRDILSSMRSGHKHPLFGTKRSKDTIDRMLATKTKNDSFAKYWLGKKRDPELIKKMTAASMTPEAIEKRANQMRGRKPTPEIVEKRAAALRGRPKTTEHKLAISAGKKGKPNGLLGRVMPEEHKEAISKATMGRRALTPEEQKRRVETWRINSGGKRTTSKAKSVICIDSGVKYRCAKEAAEALGANAKHIQACCVGRRKTHKKMRFQYA